MHEFIQGIGPYWINALFDKKMFGMVKMPFFTVRFPHLMYSESKVLTVSAIWKGTDDEAHCFIDREWGGFTEGFG